MKINYDILKSRTFWSAVIVIAYNFFATLVPLYPNVPWITVAVNVLGFVAVQYFHVAGITNAAQSSATLGKPVSGQN
jgi:hypothetical protein